MAALASHDSVSKRYSVHTCMQHDQFDHIPHFHMSGIAPRILKANPHSWPHLYLYRSHTTLDGDSARDTQNEMHLWWMGLAPESSRLKKVSELLESCKINPTMRFSVKLCFSRDQLIFFVIFNSSWSQLAGTKQWWYTTTTRSRPYSRSLRVLSVILCSCR